MKQVLSALSLLALPVLLSGCESSPTGASEGQFMQATLFHASQGRVVVLQHRGGAELSSSGSQIGRHEGRRNLAVASHDSRTNSSLELRRITPSPAGPLSPGTYTLVPRNFPSDTLGYSAWYKDGDTGDEYLAESGTWTITEVAEDGTASGHFDLTLAYWCNWSPEHVDRWRCPMSPAADGFRRDAMRLKVKGTFRAGWNEVPLF